MPRIARRKSGTGVYHLILRGVNGQTIFHDNEDGEKFLHTIKKYKEVSGYEIYAYCLMKNHAHLLIKEENEELGIAMRRIGASYVYWYNLKYDRRGHLFQDRFRSEPVEDQQYLLTVIRYIHHNPLKAGIVKDIKQYKWSSYKDYINNNINDVNDVNDKNSTAQIPDNQANNGANEITDIDFILGILNGNDKNKALEMFKEFHKKPSEDDNCLEIEEGKRIRDEEGKDIIKKVCNTDDLTALQELDKEELKTIIKKIKNKGLSTRQIARLTGIGRHKILKL